MAFKMTHPESKVELSVRKEDVPNYESQGWQAAAKSPATKDD